MKISSWKTLLFTALFLFSTSYLSGQQNGNTLLWRISGHGLKQSSYLYGTMHLNDRRLFQLGDSVYKAIENTEGFASELDMNSLGMKLINYLLNAEEEKKSQEPKKIRDVIDQQTWELYKDLLAEKLQKPADKLTVQDLGEDDFDFGTGVMKKGDMPTFLDAWLFGKMKKQGKWVGGIEDLEDQLNYVDDIEEKIQKIIFDDKYFTTSLERFIKIYANQQLDSIDAMMYREEKSGKKDFIMIRRNLKMTRRMDSLLTFRSMFFAVGAAHLPGDSGVISLLRKEGYSVTPVFSSKKINPDKYTWKKMETEWARVPASDSSYIIEMPGEAETLQSLASMGLDMKMHLDFSNLKLYMTLGFELTEEFKQMNEDSLFKIMRERVTEQGKYSKDKKIVVNGHTGREYKFSNIWGEYLVNLLIPGKQMLVLNAIFSYNGKVNEDEDSKKFFNSFSFTNKPKTMTTGSQVWERMNYPDQSFSIEFPQKPKETRDINSEEGKISYEWQALDMKTQTFYGINVSKMKMGHYENSVDTAYFTRVKEILREGFENAEIIDSSFTNVDSYPAYTVSVKAASGLESVFIKTLSIKRGGLIYYIYTVFQNESGRQNADRFLGSFRISPYQHPNWKTYSSTDGSFSLQAPYPVTLREREEDDMHAGSVAHILYDTLAGVSLFIDKTKLPGWLWYASDTAFLRNRMNLMVSYSDSITSYAVSRDKNLLIADAEIETPGNTVVKRAKIVLNGDELYELYGYFSKNDISPIYQRLYDGFSITNQQLPVDRSKSQAVNLEKFASSASGEDIKLVKEIWDNIDFTSADIPNLQRMSLKLYPDFDTTYFYGNFNSYIFSKLEELDSNRVETASWMTSNFSSIKKENEFVKPFVLAYISRLQTIENYKKLKQLFIDYPLELPAIPYAQYKFYDSIKLTATLFPEILKLADKEYFWAVLSGIATSALDSNVLDASQIKAHAALFAARAKKEIDKNHDEIEEGPYSYVDLIRLLGVAGTPESIAQLKRFSKFNSREIRFRTQIAWLEAGQPSDSKTIYTLAITDEYRGQLYDELKRINKLKLFPPDFLNQQAFAQSKVIEVLSQDDEAPEFIHYVKEKTVNFKGTQQKFYLFKIQYGFDAPEYLAIAGPYSLNSKDIISSHEATGVYWEKSFDAKKADAWLQEYLQSINGDER